MNTAGLVKELINSEEADSEAVLRLDTGERIDHVLCGVDDENVATLWLFRVDTEPELNAAYECAASLQGYKEECAEKDAEIFRLRGENAMLARFVEGAIEVAREAEDDAAKVRSNAENVLESIQRGGR